MLRVRVRAWGSAHTRAHAHTHVRTHTHCVAFHFVAPALADAGAYVVCLDLPGHGVSAHRPPSAYYSFLEYAACVSEVLDALAWERVHLLGHSLGGGLCVVLAASLPARVASLMLIENLGPVTRPASEVVKHFARALTSKSAFMRHDGSVYPNIDAAVEQRMLTVTRYAGAQTISATAARLLVERAIEPAEGAVAAAAAPEPHRVRFRHDRRIIGTSLAYLTEEQALAFLGAIACPTLVIAAEAGWPVPADVLAARLAAVQAKLKHVRLPGSHHLHLDPDTQRPVVDALLSFFVSV